MHTQPFDQTVAKLRRLPPERVAEVEDFIDFLSRRHGAKPAVTPGHQAPLDFPVDHIDKWPADLSLRREDIYGDDGR